ncbi:hypothetical protein [Methanobrevibacter sp.]|uniref:hypothetical protein n=1 Tax=Methanobrevibacter sp. TaxID=66852 RepID=UPI00388DA377
MKNTTILLILLLCVLGLTIGVYYTEASENTQPAEECEEVVYVDSSGEITIHLEPLQKNESNIVNKLLVNSN